MALAAVVSDKTALGNHYVNVFFDFGSPANYDFGPIYGHLLGRALS